VVSLLGRAGRHLPGLRVRLACRSAADGGERRSSSSPWSSGCSCRN
jgi:hypothetical protein